MPPLAGQFVRSHVVAGSFGESFRRLSQLCAIKIQAALSEFDRSSCRLFCRLHSILKIFVACREDFKIGHVHLPSTRYLTNEFIANNDKSEITNATPKRIVHPQSGRALPPGRGQATGSSWRFVVASPDPKCGSGLSSNVRHKFLEPVTTFYLAAKKFVGIPLVSFDMP